jgi:hypothetical protein
MLKTDTINEKKFIQFTERYVIELTACVQNKSAVYRHYDVSQVPDVVNKMMDAVRRGSYNKDGDAFRATMKHFGIKNTYKAINYWFNTD